MSDIDHLSYSSISTYIECPRAWKYRYIEQVKMPKAAALVLGSAFHKAMEKLITLRGEYPDYTEQDPSEIFAECWLEETDKAVIDWQGQNPVDLASAGTAMICHPETLTILNTLSPMADENGLVIERFVSLRVPGVPIPVIGYVDVITSQGIPVDIKTAGRMWTQEQAEKELQPAFYLAALNQAGFNHNPDKAFIHFVVSKPGKRGNGIKAQTFLSHRTNADLFRLFGTIAGVWKGIEAGSFPCHTNSWKCPKYCDFAESCQGVT